MISIGKKIWLDLPNCLVRPSGKPMLRSAKELTPTCLRRASGN